MKIKLYQYFLNIKRCSLTLFDVNRGFWFGQQITLVIAVCLFWGYAHEVQGKSLVEPDDSTLSRPSAVPLTENLLMRGEAMGTQWLVRLVIPEQSNIDTAQLRSRIVERLDILENQMSTWRRDSDISRFNAYQGTTRFAVAPQLVDVVRMAQGVSAVSGGMYDVTVGPLLAIWGINQRQIPVSVPSDQEIKDVLSHVGWEKLTTNSTGATLRKDHPQLRINLGSIAKGYGVDIVSETLENSGIERYLVEIGGEVRVRGMSIHNIPWRIGIEKPSIVKTAPHVVVNLNSAAMATSGSYRNFVVFAGKRYPHIISPKDGYPIDPKVVSSSVIISTKKPMRPRDGKAAFPSQWPLKLTQRYIGSTADALSTAVMVMGPERALALADAYGFALYMLVLTDTHDDYEQGRRQALTAVYNDTFVAMTAPCLPLSKSTQPDAESFIFDKKNSESTQNLPACSE